MIATTAKIPSPMNNRSMVRPLFISPISASSDTLPLIDIVMCKARGFDPACARTRLTALADMAQALGWRGGAQDVFVVLEISLGPLGNHPRIAGIAFAG